MAVASETVCSEIWRVIEDDPGIRDASHITVSVRKKGFWVFGTEEIVLTGRVRSERERQKVREIADFHAHGKAVADELQVRQD